MLEFAGRRGFDERAYAVLARQVLGNLERPRGRRWLAALFNDESVLVRERR
jgi:hypothetical protein